MEYTRKICVEFEHHIDDDMYHTVEEAKNRDISQIVVPKTAISFKFFDVLCAVVEDSGKKILLESKPLNTSPRYYYGGRLLTQDKVAWHPDILFSTMSEQTGRLVEKTIELRNGGFRPFFEGEDILIEARE